MSGNHLFIHRPSNGDERLPDRRHQPPSDAMTRATAPRARRPSAQALAAALLATTWFLILAHPTEAQSLRGSPASLDRQNRIAHRNDFTYLETGKRILYFAEQGWLVRVRGNSDFKLNAVSFPYARPDVALFVQRLASQYRAACGEQLVVTSLTRPTSRQPRNASERSVHPTGMAVDVRFSHSRSCRTWLEGVLLDLEGAGVIEATREHYPAHYHVAVFPQKYHAYVATLQEDDAVRVAQQAPLDRTEYKVRAGDSLWTIARSHGLSVDELRALNNIRGSRIYAGQVLEIPTGS